MPSEKSKSVNSLPAERWSLPGIRFRLTVLFVIIFGITLVAFSAFLYRTFKKNTLYEFDAALYNHAIDVSQAVTVDFFGDLSFQNEVFSGGGKVFPFSIGKSFIQITSADGRTLARSKSLESRSLPLTDEDRQLLMRRGVAFRSFSIGKIFPKAADPNLAYRMISYHASDGARQKFTIQIAVPQAFLDQELKGILLYFFVGIPVTLVIAMLGGFFLSGRALMPVKQIIKTLRGLQASQLSERIPVPRAGDEIRDLSLELNGLLNRLEQAFQSQERFVSDASHQLKTPLAILKGEIHVFKQKERSASELAEFIDSLSQELAYLSRMVEDLLLLARMDAGAGCLSIQKIRLDEVALEAVSRLEPLARSKGVKIRFDLSDGESNSPFEVKGDPDLLRSMFQSLIENAIKFSPGGACVEATVSEKDGKVIAGVKDQGKGISSDLLPHIFEPFFHGATDTSQDSIRTGGLGLGLTIARRIADAHDASLNVITTGVEGTQFQFQIKKV